MTVDGFVFTVYGKNKRCVCTKTKRDCDDNDAADDDDERINDDYFILLILMMTTRSMTN